MRGIPDIPLVQLTDRYANLCSKARLTASVGLEFFKIVVGLHEMGLFKMEKIGPGGRGVATEVGVGPKSAASAALRARPAVLPPGAASGDGAAGGVGFGSGGLAAVLVVGPFVRLVARQEDIIFAYQVRAPSKSRMHMDT